ncbi:MAG: RNA 2',3'-cyclic phosphodiesterase [Polyangiaceae bacterium]
MTAAALQRTFVALHVPDAVTEALVSAQDGLKRRLELAKGSRRAGPSVRWIVRQQMHVTLCFLGDTRSDQLAPVRGLLAELAHDRAALRLALRETLEIFGSPRRARALVAGVTGHDVAALDDLQRTLASRLAQHGFEPEKRRYNPHITLARVKPAGDVQHWLAEEALHLPPINFLGETLRFYRSTLTPRGGVYDMLAEVRLAG